MTKKVFVGLSGGVDSGVSALLLKQAGYQVTGVYIKGWQPDWIPCTWKDDRVSALRTAAYLDIPFITLDLEQSYKNKVVNYILQEYKLGNTPNPDMLCNKEIKFGEFLKWSLNMGANYVATGHYSIVSPHYEGRVELLESADKEKDQSYFLSQLTQEELKHILFPIGHLQKSQVRKIAEENNLPVATRKDSQGICFVGDLEMKDFLRRELNPQKGKVINESGDEIGEHQGAVLYTIGERHGFKIFKKEGDENINKYYVVEKDIQKNILVVDASPQPRALSVHLGAGQVQSGHLEIHLKNVSYTNSFEEVQKSTNLSLRIRYRGSKIPVTIQNFNESISTLNFKTQENTLYAMGQFAVLYDGEKCLGGGELS